MPLPLNVIFSQTWWRKAVCFKHKRKHLLNDKMDIQSNPGQRQWASLYKKDEHSWWIFLIFEFESYLQWNTLVFSYQSTKNYKVKGVTHALTGTFSQKYRAEQNPSFLAFQHHLWLPASLHHHHPAKSCYCQQSLKCHICRYHSSVPSLSYIGFFKNKHQTQLISLAPTPLYTHSPRFCCHP